jgi:mycofactocin precursor
MRAAFSPGKELPMAETQTLDPVAAQADAADVAGEPETVVEEDVLIEDVSIDGMCGVY